jgi:hypothetical protein
VFLHFSALKPKKTNIQPFFFIADSLADNANVIVRLNQIDANYFVSAKI